MISKRTGKISSRQNLEDKLQSDRPYIHIVPQLPKMNNAFSHRNELTIVSSSFSFLLNFFFSYSMKIVDNNSNMKSSSQLLSIKSKKELNHDNKSLKSSRFSSFNLNDNDCKSINFSLPNSKVFNYMPNANHVSSPSKLSRASFNDDLYKHKLKEIFSPTIYYSLHQMPLYESPLSARRSLYSSKSKEENKKRQNKIIKRNLYLFENTNKKQLKLLTKRKSFRPAEINFTNKKNEIFRDAAFFEEGTQNKIRKKNIFKVILGIKNNLSESAEKFKKKLILIFEMFKEESKLILDFVFLLILAFYYIWVPIKLAFIDTWEFNEGIIFDFLMISYILMLLRFFYEVKMYYKEQIDAINKKNILKSLKYFKIGFFFNAVAFLFLALFCFFPLIFSKILWGIGFLLLKFPEFLKSIKIIRKKIALNKKFHFFFSVFIIWLRVFLISNFSACVWIYLGFNYKEQNNNWLTNIQNLIEIPPTNWLIYWRCLTINLSNFIILGLGFSNEFLKPVTSAELVLIFITSSFGFIFLCYNLKCFSKIFKKLGQKHKRNVREFEGMLKNNGLKYSERRKFTKELSTVLKEHKEQKQFADSLKIISPNLQEELLFKIYWPVIEKIPSLSKNFSKEFLLKLLQKIEIVTMAPNQEIFHENDYGNECIYYILSGEIGCYIQKRGSKNKNIWIQKINKDFSFREMSFFSNKPDSFSAKCLTYTNLLRINLCDFLDLLKDFPQDYEVYHSIKEKINSYYNLNPLFLFCESCSKPHHNFLNCPYITFDKRRCFLNAHLMTSQASMKRCICFRRGRQIKNSLKNLPEIRSKALVFQKKNQEEIVNLWMQYDLKSEIHENSDSNENNSDSFEHSAYTSFTKMPKNNQNHNNNNININKNLNENNSNKIININNSNEGMIANPPSIFLQSSTKKSRLSLTESIFQEDDEENSKLAFKKQKSEELHNDKKDSINNINNSSDEEVEEFDNSEEEEDEDEDEEESIEEKSKVSKLKTISYKDETSRMISPTSNIYSHTNMTNPRENINKSYRKSFSERINSEKDTSCLLRNLDKLNKINNIESKSSSGINNLFQSKSTFKSSASSFKKNYFTNTLSNNSFVKSRTGTSGIYLRMKKNPKKSSSSTLNSNMQNMIKKNQNIKKSNNICLFEFTFDKPKEFQTFFPHNNITKVVRETNIDSILKLCKPSKKIKNN